MRMSIFPCFQLNFVNYLFLFCFKYFSEPDPYELEVKIEENLEKFIESVEIACT